MTLPNTPITKSNSLRTLAKVILSRLENRKYILFDAQKRGDVQEEFFRKINQYILTDEDLTNRVRQEISTHADQINDSNITETAAFQSRKRALKVELGEHELQGFYFQCTVRDATKRICKYLFESPLIEDVFESDEAIEKLVMETLQTFDESKIA